MKVIVTTEGCVDYSGKLYFQGDTIELPDDYGKHLLSKGVCKAYKRFADFSAPEDIGDGVIARTSELTDMTVAALKELLDKLKVSYDSKARKDELISLVEGNTGD